MIFNYKLLFAVAAIMGGNSVEGRIQTQCTQRGSFAMTFDDGPAQYTQQLLDTLASKNVKATFHITTKYLTDPNVQSVVQRIARAGHLIGLRTEASWDLFNMSDEQIRAGVARQANVLSSFIGYVPKFIRLPYNKYDDRVLRAVESTGIIVTSFNLESYDYTGDGNRIFNAIKLSLSLVGKGAGSFISLQHDSIQQSVAVTGKIIDLVKSSGYNLVKLDACLGLGDMTKNKESLKGADDSVDLGPLGGDDALGGMGGADVSGGVGGSEGMDAMVGGRKAGSSNGASSYGPSIGAAMVAAILALLI